MLHTIDTDAFLLPFIDAILNTMASHKLYSFLDGVSNCNLNLIRMYPDDLCHRMGCFRCSRKLGYFSSNNVEYVSKNHCQNLFGLHSCIYVGISWPLCGLQWPKNWPFETFTPLLGEVSTSSAMSKSSPMCIWSNKWYIVRMELALTSTTLRQ